MLVANSVQADNGGALGDGVIGISLRGRHRSPDDWGVLRAWAWGASQARDVLARDPRIDPGRIGVEGLSRYGKAQGRMAASITIAPNQLCRPIAPRDPDQQCDP